MLTRLAEQVADGGYEVAKRLWDVFTVHGGGPLVPHGVSVFSDVQKRLPAAPMTTIFDVGANVGQTATRLTRLFPQSKIYSFEPMIESYRELVRATCRQPNVSCHHLALGDEPGEARMALDEDWSVNNTLIREISEASNGDAIDPVLVDTLDRFCITNKINQIDYLKIDTEGYDLKVLQGATGLLHEQRIGLIQVEAGMTRLNTKHVPFQEFQLFLESRGYLLFGIYDQRPEWTGEARLRFSNPVFIAESLMHQQRLAA